MKKHSLKLTLNLHSITLSVKFPCNLCVNLKTQSQQEQIVSDVPLVNGTAAIQTQYVTTCMADFNSRTDVYRDKKIMLVVYLKSSSGKIPAGNATLDVNSLKKGLNKLQTNIMKCPDKSASISLSITLQVQTEQQLTLKNDEYDTKSKSSYHLNHESPRSLQQATRLNNYTIVTQLNDSKLSVQDTRPFNYRYNSQRTPLDNNYVKKNEYDSGHKRKIQYDNIVQKNGKESREKIAKLEREKSEMMREIKIIRHGFRQEPMTPREQGSRDKIRLLEKEIESQKDKMSEVELELTKKNYKENQMHRDNQTLQRKYDRLLIESTTQKTKRQVFEKSSRQYEMQLKVMKEKVQDLQLNNQNLLKKMQFKQNVLKQQLKSMSQKFSNSQSQKQRMLIEKNDLIVEFQNKQRTIRLANREKEKLWNQDKTKLFKQIQALNNSISMLKNHNEQQENLVQQLNDQLKTVKTDNSRLESQLNHQKQILDKERVKLQQQLTNHTQAETLQQQINKLQLQIKKIKKLLGQREQQILRLEQQSTNNKSIHQKLSKKLQQTQHALKQKTALNKILQREYQSTTKQLEKLKKQSHLTVQKLHDITFANQNKTSQFALLNDELHEKDRRYQQEITRIDQELKIKDRQLVHVITQLEEAKEHQVVVGNQLLSLEKDIEDMTVQVNHKFIENQNLKAQLEEIKETQDSLNRQNKRLQDKLSETTKILSEAQHAKHAQSLASQTKISQLQKRLKYLTENTTSETVLWRTKIDKLQEIIKNKDQQLKQLRAQNTDMQTEIIQREADYSELQHEMKLKLNEVQFLKEQLGQIRKQLAERNAQSQNLHLSLQQKEEQLFVTNQKVQKLTETTKQLQGSSDDTKLQLQEYKSATVKCLKQFFTMINSKQEFPQNHQMSGAQLESLRHDKSQEITKSILQSINNKNTYITTVNAHFRKHQSTINQLSKQLSLQTQTKLSLEQQLQMLQEQKQQLRNSLSLQSKGMKQATQQWNTQRQSLQKTITQLTNLAQSLEEHIIDLTNKLQKQKALNQRISTQISQYKAQIKQLSAQSQQDAKTQQSSIVSLNNQLQAKEKEINTKDKQIQRLLGMAENQKEQIKELQAKNSQSVSNLKQEKLTIKNLTKEVQDKKNQISRTQKQSQRVKKQIQQIKKSTSSKLQQTQQQLKTQLKAQQNQNSTIKQTNQSLTKISQSLTQKTKQLQTQLTQTKNQLQVHVNKTTQQLKIINAQKSQIAQLKQNNYNLESSKNKLTKDNQAIAKVKKVSQEQSQRLKQVIQSQKATLQKLTDRIKDDDKAKKQLQGQLTSFKRQSQAKTKQVQSKSNALKSLQFIRENEYKKVTHQLQQLKETNKKLLTQNTQHQNKLSQLQSKLTNLTKLLQTTEKKTAIQTNTLQPIKLLLNDIKSLITIQLKSFDNFETSKNKILKLSTQKLQNYNQKNYVDFVRDFSTALNALKTSVLAKLSDIKTKEKIILEFSTLNSLFTKWNWAGYA